MDRIWIIVAYCKDGTKDCPSRRFWTPQAAEEHAFDMMESFPDMYAEVHVTTIFKTLLDINRRKSEHVPAGSANNRTNDHSNGHSQLEDQTRDPQHLPQLGYDQS